MSLPIQDAPLLSAHLKVHSDAKKRIDMPDLIITNIRKSYFDSKFDLVTAIILSTEDHDPMCSNLAKKSCRSLFVLESATAEELHEQCVHVGLTSFSKSS